MQKVFKHVLLKLVLVFLSFFMYLYLLSFFSGIVRTFVLLLSIKKLHKYYDYIGCFQFWNIFKSDSIQNSPKNERK